MLVTLRSHLVSIQSIKDANSGIKWTGERKGDRILAGEVLKLPKGEEKKLADNSQSEGVCSQNPLIGPTIARANFEQSLYAKLYGGDSAANRERKCANCTDPSTIGQNLLGLTYPGGTNPRTFADDYSYSYVPKRLSEYPAIGHDRRYDNLGTAGAKGLLTDTRAIGADWRFVGEEFSIASNQFVDPVSRMQAGILGFGLGVAALPKTIYKLAQPNGQGLTNILIWYNYSNIGVTNAPETHTH